MRELLSWKLTLGRVRGVQLNVHFLFLLVIAVILFTCMRLEVDGAVGLGALGLLILLISVFAHEMGHAWAVRSLGGELDEVLLWPLGGLADSRFGHWTHDDHSAAQYEMIVAATGPLVNLVACLVCLPMLLISEVPVSDLINPLRPPTMAAGWAYVLSLVFWVNWLLLVANLLPALPMDGGRVVRALIAKRHGGTVAGIWIAQITRIAALALLILAVMLTDAYSFAKLPVVFLMLTVFLSSRHESERQQERGDGELFMGYDFSQGYTSLEQPEAPAPRRKAGPLRRWLQQRRQQKDLRLRQQEIEEEKRMDEILAKLSDGGLDALSPEDRRLLERVSQRYRPTHGRRNRLTSPAPISRATPPVVGVLAGGRRFAAAWPLPGWNADP